MKLTVPPHKPRRDFLSTALGIWGLLAVVPVLNVLVRYITPPKGTPTTRQSLEVGLVDDIPRGTAKIVRFDREPVIIVHTSSGQFKAFFARCTHLGCVVKFQSEGAQGFHCNCHGSDFDLNGKNLSGPAPKPLTALKVTVQQASLIVSTTEV